MAGRHLASTDGDDEIRREHLVDPGATISPGTSVTADMEAMPTHPEVRPSAPNPDALVEGGRVGDGHELE